MGFNEASGDTMLFNYKTKNLEHIHITGDARGIFYPEKNKTKLDSLHNEILIDTGDLSTDKKFTSYVNIITGYKFSELKKTKSVYL